MTTTPPQELSSRYDPLALETELYAQWEQAGYFHADPARPGEPFTIVIPPPNVTGYLHIGHALNNTLQDILTRYHRMAGDNALWVPGTDHAGIATQHVVERELLKAEGKDRRDLGRDAFLERVWAWKEQYGSRIITQLKRLGCSCDWDRTRFTMDEGLSRAVLTVFKRLFEEGLIYRGDYLVNWSPKLQTALSDDEVVHKDVNGHLWSLRYPAEDGGEGLVVATTRPETMLGDTAVAVHPEDERYQHLIGKRVILPLMNRPIPVIADTFVDRTFGTGAVKVTPAHDPNDYEMGKRHNLEFINLLNPDGTLNDNAGPYKGLTTQEGRKRVVADLEALGLLVKIEDHQHAVGHCYRSGCVVEPYLSKQWFVKMRPLCEPAVQAVREGRVRFLPEHHTTVYYHWMENVRDWCISRQLWWGHRIPIFECADCGHLWCEVDTVPERCPKCSSAKIAQDPDVLDTWFSSALWPFSTLGWPDATPELKRYYPTSVLITAHDIIFFWVARMIVMGLKFMGEVPFHTVVINPLVRDEHGKKMSKSSGTAVDPLEIIDEMGADTMRLTMASYPTQTGFMSLSPKRFESMRNFNNKLWNAARFVLKTTEDLPAQALADGFTAEDLELEDRWILNALATAAAQAQAGLESYAFDQYVDALYKFIWNQYCDWYVELVKDRLYKGGEDGQGRHSARSRQMAQVVLVTVLEQTLRLLHPVAPFITEALWQQIKGRWASAEGSRPISTSLANPSIMVAPWPVVSAPGEKEQAEAFYAQQDPYSLTWPTGPYAEANADVDAQMDLIQQVIYLMRNIRGEMGVPPSTATDVEIISENTRRLAMIQAGEHYLRSLLSIATLKFGAVPTLQGFVSTNAVEDVTVRVTVPQELVDAEKGRLQKEIARLEKGVEGSRRKLDNEKFVASAPPQVVQDERERCERMQKELESLRQRLTTLQ